MGKFDGILFCTDLDGTIYKNDKTISKRNKDAIEYFKSEGGRFTFITGRLPYYTGYAYNSINPNAPFGCINGGGVYDGESKRYIWTQELSHEALELVKHIDESFSEVGVQICCFDKTYFAVENSTTIRFREITGLPALFCDYRTFTEPIAKIIFCTDDGEKMSAIQKALTGHEMAYMFDFVRSERTLYEIVPKGMHKGVSLKKLAEHLNIDIKRTIAIGDYDNDVEMLRAAGCGIAVANASESAMKAARFVTVSNEDDAIAAVIQSLEMGEYGI